MRPLVIAWANLLRLMRDRLGWFFIFALPMIIIVVLGLQFGTGFAPRIGVVASEPGERGEALLAGLANQEPRGWVIRRHESSEELRGAVERGEVEVGLVLPDRYGERLAAGERLEIGYVAPANDLAIGMRSAVEGEVEEQAAVLRAARFAADERDGALDAWIPAADQMRASLPRVETRVSTVGDAALPAGGGGFAIGAQSQLVLFMFLTSLTGAAQLILSRRLGVSRRMVATPTSIPTILVGEALGRFGVAMLQGLFIVLATALAFGVEWGDPLAAGSLIVAFALVGAGAAMLIGAVANNAEQASSLGVVGGLGLAAIGGAMVPAEIFPPIMQTISRFTPHRWAIDGLGDVAAGSPLPDVMLQLGVLLAFAAVLMTLAVWRFRIALTR
jgi:ABC-2 type transport system permease protein